MNEQQTTELRQLINEAAELWPEIINGRDGYRYAFDWLGGYEVGHSLIESRVRDWCDERDIQVVNGNGDGTGKWVEMTRSEIHLDVTGYGSTRPAATLKAFIAAFKAANPKPVPDSVAKVADELEKYDGGTSIILEDLVCRLRALADAKAPMPESVARLLRVCDIGFPIDGNYIRVSLVPEMLELPTILNAVRSHYANGGPDATA